MDRRAFLRSLGGLGASGALAGVLAACGAPAQSETSPTATRHPHRKNPTRGRLVEVDGLPTAEWLIEENARPDATRAWIVPHTIPNSLTPPIEGYLDRVSYLQGEELTLYVNTVASHFQALVFRIGFYGGFGGRRVTQSPELVGVRQKAATFTPGVNMVECHWSPSWRTTVGADWPPGNYLIKLFASTGEQRYVPFTVRDDTSRAAFVVQNSVTTWQAYNTWGGYSLYGGGPHGVLADRSRVISFDRPYYRPDAHGSGDWLGNEFPFIYLAERHGLDVTYWTDVDLSVRPQLLLNHRCLISLGHDEYWSMAMRDGAEAALREGVNLVFLGANACYRQIRLRSSALGPDRRVVCYKDALADPIYATDKALATGVSWSTDPIPRPESDLIGTMYRSFGASGPLVVGDSSSWVYAGTGLRDGASIPHVLGSEFDGFAPQLPGPAGGVEILAHSPTPSVSGPSHSDMTYYSLPGAGGVFATGTASWVTDLWDGVGRTPYLLGFGIQHKTVAPLTKITLNVLSAFGRGPASATHPSVANWRRFYLPNQPVGATGAEPT